MARTKHVGSAVLSSSTIALAFVAACSTPAGNVALGVGAVGLIGGRTPSQSIEQTYYVGVFDPLEQVPPAVYRLTVRGQASAISAVRFASGWVPAVAIDSLGTRVGFDQNGLIKAEGKDATTAGISPARRMMMFGPEGFREAPKDHRLVIVMGSNPDAFFQIADEMLETAVKVQTEQLESNEAQNILAELNRLHREQRELDEQSDRSEDLTAKIKES